MKAVPERGRIAIHNRSHYEEVVIVRVHPAILQGQQLPKDMKLDKHSGRSVLRTSTTSSAPW